MFSSYRSVLGGASLFILCQQSSQSITPSCSPAAPPSPSQCLTASTATFPSSLALPVQGSAWQNGGSRGSHFWSQASRPAPEAGCTSTLQGGIWTTSDEACLVRWSRLKLERTATSNTQDSGKSVMKSNKLQQMAFLPLISPIWTLLRHRTAVSYANTVIIKMDHDMHIFFFTEILAKLLFFCQQLKLQ